MARSKPSDAVPEIVCPDALGNATLPYSGDTLSTFRKLKSSTTLRCFSYVDLHLLRGGQPALGQLSDLEALGVKTIVSLRRENVAITRAERAESLRLGLKFAHFPFYGIFGARHSFVERVLAEIRDPVNSVVYLHCQRGRDRTSLLVALHLVIDHAWDPERAWQEAVLDYGFRTTLWYRRFRYVFDSVVALHKKKIAGAEGSIR